VILRLVHALQPQARPYSDGSWLGGKKAAWSAGKEEKRRPECGCG